MIEIIKRIIEGIVIGCTIFTIIGIIFCLVNGTDTAFGDPDYGFVKMAICSMIVGLGFSLPTFIYDDQKITKPLQTLIHLSIGFIIFGLVAFYAKWVPIESGIKEIVVFIILSILSTLAIWYCFYLYYKNEARKINDDIRKKQNKN